MPHSRGGYEVMNKISGKSYFTVYRGFLRFHLLYAVYEFPDCSS